MCLIEEWTQLGIPQVSCIVDVHEPTTASVLGIQLFCCCSNLRCLLIKVALCIADSPLMRCTYCVGTPNRQHDHRVAIMTLSLLQVLACVNMLLGLVDYLPMGHDSRPGTSCTSTQSAHSTSEHQSSPFSSASQHADGSSPDPTQSPLQLQSTQRMAASPLPAYCPLLETATSLSSVNTTS